MPHWLKKTMILLGLLERFIKYLTGNSSGYWLIYLISVELLTERAEQEMSSAKHLTLL
jgi:hypothetical protein